MKTLTAEDRAKVLLPKGKRKSVERAPKILLCNPLPKYWPRINEEDVEAVHSLLRALLVKEREKPKIPWKKFMKLPKEARKERMKEIYSKEVISRDLQKQRKYLKVGLNAVARAIQRESISSCLLAGDVVPDFLISHLVTMAGTRGIPVLIVPSLKDTIFKILGFSATALGITIDDDGEYLKSLNELIKKLSSQFPVPFHYARIRREADTNGIKSAKRAHKAILSTADSQGDESNRDMMIGDFFIDVAPGPSVDKVIYETETAEGMESDIDFISLNSAENKKQLEKSANQLYEDYMNNLLYIAPNFTRMQKNCNRQGKKRLFQI